MTPRWVPFAAAGALGVEVAAWITFFGARPWNGIDAASLAACLGLHVFSAVLLGEAGRARAPAEGSTVAWRRALAWGLLPGLGAPWVILQFLTDQQGRAPQPTARERALAGEAPSPLAEELCAVEVDPPAVSAVFAASGAVLALLALALAQGAAALLWARHAPRLALWTVAAFQLLLALAATATLAARRRPARATKLLAPLLTLVAMAALAAQLTGLWRAAPTLTASASLPLAGALLVLTFPQLLLHRWLADRPGLAAEERALAPWAAAGQWLSLFAAGLLVVEHLGLPGVAVVGFRLLQTISALVALELVVRGIGRLFTPEPALAPRSLFLAALTSGRNPLASLLDALERELGLSFRSSFTVGWVRSALLPLGLLLAAVLWAATALVIVEPTEQGLVYRWGRLLPQEPLVPGLHLKAPWPIDQAVRRVVTRVRRIEVGYVGEGSQRSLLWTTRHRREHKLLLGGGRELLSVNAIIDYRIDDLRRYLQSFSEPRRALRALADRVLLRRTAGRPLAALLTVDRAAFARTLERDLQGALDQAGLGLRVLRVALLGLHPPVAAASAYQAVVSAQLGIRTEAIQGRRDAIKHKEHGAGRAAEQVLRARARAAARRGRAHGEARWFQQVVAAYREQPALYRLRRRFELLERRLPGTDLFVIDPKVASAASELWVDLSVIDNR